MHEIGPSFPRGSARSVCSLPVMVPHSAQLDQTIALISPGRRRRGSADRPDFPVLADIQQTQPIRASCFYLSRIALAFEECPTLVRVAVQGTDRWEDHFNGVSRGSMGRLGAWRSGMTR